MTELEIRQTREFSRWFGGLRDREAQARILIRIRRLSLGNIGDAASVGGGLSELKVDYGPGYRVYVMRAGNRAFVLLAGGDKRTQTNDIKRALSLMAHLKDKA